MIRKQFGADMIGTACGLSTGDLERHATISKSNNHECGECFTCCCAWVLRLRKVAEELELTDKEFLMDVSDYEIRERLNISENASIQISKQDHGNGGCAVRINIQTFESK